MTLRNLAAAQSLAADSLILADGTLWSHAATLGTRTKGVEFTIGADEARNAVRVFTTGYPQKIPVDYDHASTSTDPEIRKLAAQGMVPKAGAVQELRAVTSVDEFTDELKAAAEKLCAQANPPRSLDDPRNLGLWMRWKPTARALASIKAGEYTELSITFDENLPHNVDEHGQGFGLWAVALLNTPFLDDMLPVAASRTTVPPPRSAAQPERHMTTKLLSLVAAVRGKPVATEDEAITELTGLQTELTALRAMGDYRAVIAAELGGEADPVKGAAMIKQLRADLGAAKAKADEQADAAIKATVDATLTKYEKAIGSVPLRAMLSTALTVELKAGKKLEETDTMKTILSLPEAKHLTQSSTADAGGAGAGDDERLDAKARELMSSNGRLKALAARDRQGEHEAYKEALLLAEREFANATT